MAKKSKSVKKPSDGQFQITRKEAEPLDCILKRLKIKNWDFVIFGDGSGSNWNRESSWASVSVEKATMERLVWYGYTNRGTVNTGEAMAYLWPAMWIANREAARVSTGSKRRATQVHVITDSEYVQKTGRKGDRMLATNGPIWEGFSAVERQGVVFTWHWLRRDTVGLNQYVDKLSKLVRKSFRAYNMQERMSINKETDVIKTVYEINPG